MNIIKVQLFYLNIILLFCLLHNDFLLCLYFFLIRFGYYANLDCDVQYTYDHHYHDLERDEAFYEEQDVDGDFLLNLQNEEVYLFYNCRFFFDYFGGNTTLELEDYYILDNLYNNIYNELYLFEEYINPPVEDDLDYLFYKKQYYLLTFLYPFTSEKYHMINNPSYSGHLNGKKRKHIFKLWYS